MKFFLQCYVSDLISQLRSWRNWLMLLILPLMTAALVLGIPKEEMAAPVQVGVVLPEGQGEAFWEHLSERSDAVVSFLRCEEDTLRAKVSTGQWDCGMILDEEFDERLAELDTDGVITFFTGPGSTVYPVVQETAATAVLDLISEDLALRYMARNDIEDVFHLQELEEDSRVLVSLQTRTGESMIPVELADKQLGGIILGCLGLVLLIWALFGAMDLGKWIAQPSVKRFLMLRDSRVLLLSRGGAMLSMSAIGAAAAVCLVPQRLWALLALIPYLLSIWAMALLLSRVKALWSALPSLMSAVTVLSVLTSPILFDLTGLHPALDAVMNWLPLNLFLRSAQGDPSALLRSALPPILLLTTFALIKPRNQ